MKVGIDVNQSDWEINYCQEKFGNDPDWINCKWIRDIHPGIICEIDQAELKNTMILNAFKKVGIYTSTVLGAIALNYLIAKSTDTNSNLKFGFGIIANLALIKEAIEIADKSQIEPETSILKLLTKNQANYSRYYSCNEKIAYSHII